jgi:hypothetical protein
LFQKLGQKNCPESFRRKRRFIKWAKGGQEAREEDGGEEEGERGPSGGGGAYVATGKTLPEPVYLLLKYFLLSQF